MDRVRCFGDQSELYSRYHDEDWGVPVHDDRLLFELLILEGAQAGLSWETILKRRDTYRTAFDNFDIAKVAAYSSRKTAGLLADTGIIRNRLKIASAIGNANGALALQDEFGGLDSYFWSYVDGHPVQSRRESMSEVPASTEVSERMSKDLARLFEVRWPEVTARWPKVTSR